MASPSSSSSDISITTVSDNGDTVRPRGRGRPRRSAVGGRSGRGRGRGGGTTRSSPVNVPTLEERKESLKAEIKTLTREEMAEVLVKVIEVEPGVLFYAMRPSNRLAVGYHPDPNNPSADWCVYGYCREMPTDADRLCCRKQQCISRTQRFETLILDEGVLAMGRLLRRDILVFPDEDLGEDQTDYNKANRFYAYIQFTLWSHGRLGSGNKVPIPSCCVWRIRDKFPDPYGKYVGFIPALV